MKALCYMSISAAIAVFVAGVVAVTTANKNEDYRRFAKVMDQYGYSWEAVEVETEDGFLLTTFHVTGNSEGLFTPTMPPVLI